MNNHREIPEEAFFSLMAAGLLECSGEGLVRQRLLQRRQRGELPLVAAGEPLGFGLVHAGRVASGAALFSYSTKPTRRM